MKDGIYRSHDWEAFLSVELNRYIRYLEQIGWEVTFVLDEHAFLSLTATPDAHKAFIQSVVAVSCICEKWGSIISSLHEEAKIAIWIDEKYVYRS